MGESGANHQIHKPLKLTQVGDKYGTNKLEVCSVGARPCNNLRFRTVAQFELQLMGGGMKFSYVRADILRQDNWHHPNGGIHLEALTTTGGGLTSRLVPHLVAKYVLLR